MLLSARCRSAGRGSGPATPRCNSARTSRPGSLAAWPSCCRPAPSAVKTGELLTEIARAREATGHTARDAQRPLARIAGVQSALIAVRSQVLHAHGDLRKLGETMSIPFECPNSAGNAGVPVIGQTVQAVAA